MLRRRTEESTRKSPAKCDNAESASSVARSLIFCRSLRGVSGKSLPKGRPEKLSAVKKREKGNRLKRKTE